MTTHEQWLALAKRCAEAKLPDVEIDAAICILGQYTGTNEKGVVTNIRFDPDFSDDDLCFAVDGVDDCCNAIPALTFSLDAVVSLIEKTLPGWAWKVGTCSVSDDGWLVPDFNCKTHGARFLMQFGEPAPGSIWDMGIDIDRRPPGNVALALCQAYCLARAELAKEDNP